MTKVSSLEFQRQVDKFLHEAQRGPIEITHHGRRDLVLLSAEYFDWLNAAAKRAHATADGANPFMLEALNASDMSIDHTHLNEDILPAHPDQPVTPESEQAAARIRTRAAALQPSPFDWEEWKAFRDEGRR
jgi:prevent-host-death family protein